jgi:UDP-glucose 4-epimerase
VLDGSVDFMEADLRQRETAQKCVHDVDAIVHLAALVSPALSFKQPVLTFETNVSGTSHLLDASAKGQVKRFIFVSSCAVYGEPSALPLKEEHPKNPCSPYGASKLLAENQCCSFRDEHGLDTVILRLFNVYGSRQGFNEYSGVISKFINRARRKLPLVIYGDGSQTRDYVHVSDVATAILKTLRVDTAKREVFNIGSGRPTSVNSLAKTILEQSGNDVKVTYEEPREGDVKQSYADISRAEKLLDYRPRIPLEDGLRKIYKIGEDPSAEER